MERETGAEPATSSLGSWHSTTELLPPSVKSAIYLNPLDFLGQRPVYSVHAVYPILPVWMPKWTAKQTAQQPENRGFRHSYAVSSCCPFSLSKARSRHNIAQRTGGGSCKSYTARTNRRRSPPPCAPGHR